MPMDPLVSRARALWQELAAEPGAGFGTPGRPTVLVAPDSALAPPSWVGVVAVGDAALITAPTDRAADSVRSALTGLTTAALTDPAAVARLLPVADLLGPAALGYLAPDALRPAGR
ncbi:GNAT family N-acetyltransferase, partial [Streptomyces sp. SID5614]|nr:GNAT family N-acetyltransferase [Streptomyces sp. SID5614]